MTLEKKLIIFILTFLILTSALFFTITKPAFLEMRDLAEKIEKQKIDLEELYQKGKSLAQVKDELKEIENKNILLESIFLPENKELEFITTLEKLSADNGIQQEISLKTKIPFENNYQVMSIHLNLKSSFNNLIKYFRAIENLDFYFNITSLNIVNLSGLSDTEEVLGVTIDANTYWLKTK